MQYIGERRHVSVPMRDLEAAEPTSESPVRFNDMMDTNQAINCPIGA